MILAFASACHGRNVMGQWYIVALAAALWALVGFAVVGLVGAAAGLLVPVWWLLFRRGHQAHIEMRCMDTGHPFRTRLRDVLRAHYYCGWLTCLALFFCNYSTRLGQWLGWEHKWAVEGHVRGRKVRVDEFGRVHEDDKPFWDCRRPTEFATGLTGDIMKTAFLIILGGIA